MLEETGLIERVGTWLFDRAAADCEYWRQGGLQVPRMAINVSPLQLRCTHFRSWLLSICELTESSLLPGADELVVMLESLVAANVRLALDDFGVGYSSLSLLTRLPVSYLKIDRSFIAGMAACGKAGLVVRAITRLGHEMGMEAVAEGIETMEQLRRLQREGCDIGQGHLFCPAVGREELLERLVTHGTGERPAMPQFHWSAAASLPA
jgi:EAL domain-containing protein (putative c-di-GMP-specific phosphodiesterase class I)